MTLPTVTVLMPVYNAVEYLDEAIESIRNQTLQEWELIVVDDGSTDGSLETAREHARLDPRVVVYSQSHEGIAAALNKGLSLARSPWAARLDADDISMPERLKVQLEFLKSHPEVMALGTYAWMMGPTGRRFGVQKLGPVTIKEFQEMRRANKVVALLSNSVVFHRDTAIRIGGHRTEYRIGEDTDLWSRIADDHVVLTIPEPLVATRYHPDSTTARNMPEMLRNARLVERNMIRRRSGQPELTIDEYGQLEEQIPRVQRIRRQRDAKSQAYYRRGGALLTERKPRGIFWLLGSFALNPTLPTRRLRKQVMLPRWFSKRRDEENTPSGNPPSC